MSQCCQIKKDMQMRNANSTHFELLHDDVKVSIILINIYLHGRHHMSCWSKPYLARHFFMLAAVIKEKNMDIYII